MRQQYVYTYSHYPPHTPPSYTIQSAVIDTLEITILYVTAVLVLSKLLYYVDKSMCRSRRFIDAYRKEIEKLRNESNSEEEQSDSESESEEHDPEEDDYKSSDDIEEDTETETEEEVEEDEEDEDISFSKHFLKEFIEHTLLPFPLDNCVPMISQKENVENMENVEEEQDERRNTRLLLTEYIHRTFVSEDCIQKLCAISDGMEDKMKQHSESLLQIQSNWSQLNQDIRLLEEKWTNLEQKMNAFFGQSSVASSTTSSASSVSMDSIGESGDTGCPGSSEFSGRSEIPITENLSVDWNTVDKPEE